MRIILLVSVIWLCRPAFAQHILEGRVTNEQKEPLAGVSVILKKEGPVLAFARTDTRGYFKITYRASMDSLQLFAQAMAYAGQSRAVVPEKRIYNFILRPSSRQLEEIRVRPPVSRKNDTLSYGVDFLTRAGDRTLADVMKRIPGLEVSSTGRITYQGNPIEKYYIEGLDLLGGRYGLANNNLPAEKVDRVEVLENHQSVRMLDGVQQSYRTSLNIRLKNKYTTTIPVVTGAGASPLMGLAEFLPMVFSPQKQFIGGFKANNTGKDITIDGAQHNSLADLLEEQVRVTRSDIVQVSLPAIDADRYRFNESAYATVNNLNRLKKDLQLRLNAGYMYDQLKRESVSEIAYNLYEGTIVLAEENKTRQSNSQFRLEAELSENSTGKYFANKTRMTLENKNGRGDLLTSGAFLDQEARNRLSNFRNDFSRFLKAGPQLIRISSTVSYKDNPQSLRIFNSGYGFSFAENARQALQEINDKKLDTDLIVQGYRKIAGLDYTLKTGGQFHRHRMESDLLANSTSLYQNDLHWTQYNVLTEQQIEKNGQYLRLKLTLPWSYRSFQIRDDLYGIRRDVKRFPFEPAFFMQYITRKNWEFQTNLSRRYRFGSMESMYTGFILKDYRTLNQRDVPLAEDLQYVVSAVIKYNNPFKYISAWLTTRYAHTERNIMTSGILQENGSITTVAFLQKNPMHHTGINGVLRYIVPGKDATLNLSGGWTRQTGIIRMNDRFTDLLNNSLNARIGWGILPAKKVNVKADHEFTRTLSRPEGTASARLFQQKHTVDIRYPLAKKHFFWTKGEYYAFKMTTGNLETGFWDMGYRYIQKKIEVEASWQNILNKNRFENATVSEFSEFYQSLMLRPARLLLTFRWTFSP